MFPPQIINGRVMVPVRFVAEALDCNVDWDGINKTVRIVSNTRSVEPDEQGVIETTFKNMRAIEVNGETYFNANDYTMIIGNGKANPEDYITYDKNSKIIAIYYKGKITKILPTEENAQIYKGQTYLNTKFYK